VFFLFSQNLQEIIPISWKLIIQSMKNFGFEAWGLKPSCMLNFINFWKDSV